MQGRLSRYFPKGSRAELWSRVGWHRVGWSRVGWSRVGLHKVQPRETRCPRLPLLPAPTKGFGNVGRSACAFPTCVSQCRFSSTKRDGLSHPTVAGSHHKVHSDQQPPRRIPRTEIARGRCQESESVVGEGKERESCCLWPLPRLGLSHTRAVHLPLTTVLSSPGQSELRHQQ